MCRWLRRGDFPDLTGRAPLLAAAGDRGRSREDLLLHLWPDSTPERARNVLKQTVYALRRDLKAPDLVLADHDVLRLNPAVITSDVAQFEAALARGDLDLALELYRGPFLEGFHLRESPEFEHWAQAERGRLASEFARVVDSLAGRSRGRRPRPRSGALATAARRGPARPECHRRPDEALAAAGDPAGALRQAHVHEILRREQLGQSPDPDVAALAEHSYLTDVDLASGQLAAPMALAGGGFGVGVTPDDNQAYIAIPSAGLVQVFGLQSRKLAGTINVGGEPRRIGFSRAGKIGAVTNAAGYLTFIR